MNNNSANGHFFNRNTLSAAVATVILGSTVGVVTAADVYITNDETIDNSTGTNATDSYIVSGNNTLTFNGTTGSNGHYYGNFTSAYIGTVAGDDGMGNFAVNGNVTLHGNVGLNADSSANGTGNWTLLNGNTLVLSENVTVFNAQNMTLSTNTVLNLGSNATTGVNRDADHELTYFGNISMAGNSTINVGNGTTIDGNIYGATDAQGTLNIVGNFTHAREIGGSPSSDWSLGVLGLDQINISANNTFTTSKNVTATRMDINGTVTTTGNITAAVTMGSGSTLNLNTESSGGTNTQAANVTGAIQSGVIDTPQGTLNINGTWATGGAIGQDGLGLEAINIDSSANSTSETGFTTTFVHNVNATTITLGTATGNKNATLAIAAGGRNAGENIVITGSIVGGTNSTSTDNAAGGRFLVAGNATVSGSIGTSDGRLADIRIEDGATLTMTGSGIDVYANNITMMDNDNSSADNATLAFNGTGTTNVYGIVAGESTEGEGLIDINAGTVSFNSTVGTNTNYISAINVATGSNMTTMSNIYANDTIKILGTLDINQSQGITIFANDANSDGGGLQIGNTSGTNGTLETSGTITLSSNTTGDVDNPTTHSFNNATIALNGTHSSHITSGTGYIEIGANNQSVIIQGDTTIDLDLTNTVATDGLEIVIIGRGSDTNSNGTLNVSGNISAVDNYGMFDITINNSTAFSAGYASDVANASLNATVTYTSAATLGYTENTKATYDGAKTAIGSDTAIFQALAAMTTAAEVKTAIETLEPDASGGSAAAVSMISSAQIDTVGDRLIMARRNRYGTGMNTGDSTLDNALWLQAFGSDITQDDVDAVSGYDADGAGLVLGIDGLTDDGVTRIGIAGSFATTDVSGKDGTRQDKNDIDTAQITGYFRNDYESYYVDGAISFANNDNDISRKIVVGAITRTATASYDSDLTAFRIGAGWPTKENGLTTTPTLGMTWTHLETDAYTETGAGNMNLTVTPDDIDTVEVKAGLIFTGESTADDGSTIRPQFRIGVVGDISDDTADSTATFAGGGSSFNTTGLDKDDVHGDVGIGFTYTNPQNDTDISLNADGRFSDSYTQYGGQLTVKWKF